MPQTEEVVAVRLTEAELKYLIDWLNPEIECDLNTDILESIGRKLLAAKEYFPHA